jgi:hypothetical protein
MGTFISWFQTEEEEEDVAQLKPSENADVVTLFTKPTGTTGMIIWFFGENYSRTSLARTRKDCQNVFELLEIRATEVP